MLTIPLRAAAVLAVLYSGAAAQLVVPTQEFATVEGGARTAYPFSVASRHQQIHDDLNSQPAVLNGISFRRDGILANGPHPAVAPTTVTLTLDLAPSVSFVWASDTFANNRTGNPTRVFSGVISTPAAWQVPARLAPTTFDLRIPLQPWSWNGSPFLWDLETTATSTGAQILVDAAIRMSLDGICSYQMQGAGCATAQGTLEIRGSGWTGGPLSTVQVTTAGGPASGVAAWLIGLGAAPTPVPGLCAPLWPQSLTSLSGATDAAGSWQPSFSILSPPLLGTPLEMQVAVVDPLRADPIKVAVSNGLSYEIEWLAPTFRDCCIQSLTPGSPTGHLLPMAAIVRFD